MNEEQRLDERFRLEYRAEYSARYHRRRASFLIGLDKFSNLVSIIAGTSVFVSLIQGGPTLIAQLAALVISALAIGQVVYGFGASGARHAEWMKAWEKLANDIRATPEPSEDDLREWNQARAEIEGECVSELRALANDCENQAKAHMGISEGVVRIGRFQRLFIHLGTFQVDFPEIEKIAIPSRPKEGGEGN